MLQGHAEKRNDAQTLCTCHLQLTDGQISIHLFLLLATVSVSAESDCYYTASFRLRPLDFMVGWVRMKMELFYLEYSGITSRLIRTPKLLKLKRNKSLRAGLIVPARSKAPRHQIFHLYILAPCYLRD